MRPFSTLRKLLFFGSIDPTFKGRPRAYEEAVSLGVIDERIRDLVAAINILAIAETLGSCEGHRRIIGGQQGPFVAYRATNNFACNLERRIRTDEISPRPVLHYYWTNRAFITADFELGFILSAPAIDAGNKKLCRSRVNADFATLASMVKEAAQEGETADPIGIVGGKNKCHDDDNPFKPSLEKLSAERIERTAMRASPALFIGVVTDSALANVTCSQTHGTHPILDCNSGGGILAHTQDDLGRPHDG